MGYLSGLRIGDEDFQGKRTLTMGEWFCLSAAGIFITWGAIFYHDLY
jgi:hypothetical protein